MESTGNPRLDELIASAVNARLAEVFTTLPGIITRYDKAKKVVDVQPAINRAVERVNGETVFFSEDVIQNVPIAWPSGGRYIMRWPLVPGDGVELRFSHRATGQFRSTGQKSDPEFLGLHQISYPTAWPCEIRFKQSETVLAEVADAFQIDGPGGLVVGKPTAAEAVAIASKVQDNLDALKSALEGATYAPGPGSPVVLTLRAPIVFQDISSSNLKAEL